MAKEDEALDKFGLLLMERVRDEAISQWDMVLDGRAKAPAFKRIYERIVSSLDAQQIQLLRYLVPKIVDTTLHHLLWTLEQEEWVSIAVNIDSEMVPSLSAVSDGLAGELYGWIPKFSKERYDPDLEEA